MSARMQSFVIEEDGCALVYFEGDPGPAISLRLQPSEVAGMAEASAVHIKATDPHAACHCQGPLDVCCSPVHSAPKRRPSTLEQQCLTPDLAHAPHTWVSARGGDRLCHGVTVKDALTEVLAAKAKTELRIRALVEAEGPYAGPSEKHDAEREIRQWLECGGRP